MEKATQDKHADKQQKRRRPPERLPDAASIGDELALPPMEALLQTHRPEQLLRLQRSVGNKAIQQRLVTTSGPRVMRAVEYNAEIEGGRVADPELAAGVLPFTDEGWNGREIGRRLSQLNPAAPTTDEVRCVQTSFLVALAQRGPGAVNNMIADYLGRYRTGLRQASTPPNIRRWYQRSIRNLSPIPAKIDGKTATYDDLSTLLREMYDVYGGARGTGLGAQASMFRREGYTAVDLNVVNATQAQAAAQAATLEPGQFLSCAVNSSRLGTGPINHAVHIGAYPDNGNLYFYDPAPVVGAQLIDLDANLNAMSHYFVNQPGETAGPVETITFEEEEAITITAGEGGAPGAEVAPEGESAEEAPPAGAGEEVERQPTQRTFVILAKNSPPAPSESEEAEA